MCSASAFSRVAARVVERNHDPQRDADGEEQNSGDFSRLALQPLDHTQQLQHLEGAHEVPLGMNTHGRGR